MKFKLFFYILPISNFALGHLFVGKKLRIEISNVKESEVHELL